MRMRFLPLFFAGIVGLVSCGQSAPQPQTQTQGTAAQAEDPPPVLGYQILASYPHDPGAFTQGLFFRDGHLYESTGLVGQSTLRKVRLEDGAVLHKIAIPEGLFGEGMVDWKDEIVSVTWRDGLGFRWSVDGFRPLGKFRLAGEGWGLTQDGTHLILSDGTPALRFLDPVTFEEKRRVRVTSAGRPVGRLNELEYIKGEVWANVWGSGGIARIDPETGKVKAWVDLRPLAAEHQKGDPDRVLNGIAWDEKGDRIFVTGKNWPKLYAIDVPSAPRAK